MPTLTLFYRVFGCFHPSLQAASDDGRHIEEDAELPHLSLEKFIRWASVKSGLQLFRGL